MHSVRLQNLTHPIPLPITATYCDTFWSRFRGLMLRQSLAAQEGLILVNSSDNRLDAAIHMLFMNFDITAVWVNSQNTVVDVKIARRWRPVIIPQAAGRFVLELHPDQHPNFQVGDRIEMTNA
jgi:uncharacterized membrane protein (UPF0127 family)